MESGRRWEDFKAVKISLGTIEIHTSMGLANILSTFQWEVFNPFPIKNTSNALTQVNINDRYVYDKEEGRKVTASSALQCYNESKHV